MYYYSSDKQSVIIDFGRRFTKVGFSGECRPRHIFPTPELYYNSYVEESNKREYCSPAKSVREWILILEPLIHRIFHLYLKVNPKERKVVICEQIYLPATFRSAVFYVLFEALQVAAVQPLIDLALPLYLSGVSTGLVIDIGYGSTKILPTFAGVPLILAFQEIRYGGRYIDRKLKKLCKPFFTTMPTSNSTTTTESEGTTNLEDSRQPNTTMPRGYYGFVKRGRQGHPDDNADYPDENFELVEDIKIKCCFIRYGNFEAPDSVNNFRLDEEIRYRDDLSRDITLPKKVRYELTELCFTDKSLMEAIFKAIDASPKDCQKLLLQNIIFVGGGAQTIGFIPRCAQEIFAWMKKAKRQTDEGINSAISMGGGGIGTSNMDEKQRAKSEEKIRLEKEAREREKAEKGKKDGKDGSVSPTKKDKDAKMSDTFGWKSRLKKVEEKDYMVRGFEPNFARIDGVPPFLRVWVSASLCASLEGGESYTLANYKAKEPLPDWTRSAHM